MHSADSAEAAGNRSRAAAGGGGGVARGGCEGGGSPHDSADAGQRPNPAPSPASEDEAETRGPRMQQGRSWLGRVQPAGRSAPLRSVSETVSAPQLFSTAGGGGEGSGSGTHEVSIIRRHPSPWRPCACAWVEPVDAEG